MNTSPIPSRTARTQDKENARPKRLRTNIQAGDNPGMGPYDAPVCKTVPYRSTDGTWSTIEACT
jgi:hypothetical protein